MPKGAGGGRPAKSPEQRRNREKPAHETVTLPAQGRKGRAPKPPVDMSESADQVYRWLWHTQEATQWTHADALPAARLAELMADCESWQSDPKLLAEMRQVEDRLGLTPYARRQLRWALPGEDAEDARPRESGGSVTRLRAVDPQQGAAG